MGWEREFSVDEIEQQLISDELLVSQIRARQIRNLELLDTAQIRTADGCKSLSEWVARKCDVSLESARLLVRTMRRTQDKAHLRDALASGEVSFDRAEGLSRLEDEKDFFEHLDVAGIRRIAADRIRLTVDDETRSAEDQFLVLQPNLDESWWKLWGGLDGVTGAVVEQALTEKADSLPDLPAGVTGSVSWRKAIALYELASGGKSPQAQVTVFIDANRAATTMGQAGVRLEAGPRIGAQALEAVLCDSVTEVTVNIDDGKPMSYGRRTRNIPPQLRRAVLSRNGGHCEIHGCDSRYRVEVHHKTPWSRGGHTDPDNLIAVCWFHHHIAIHQNQLTVFTDAKGRVLLERRTDNRGPPGSAR